MATKVDFKHELRELYGASREPQLVDVPVLNYLMIDGHGDPNTAVNTAKRSRRCMRSRMPRSSSSRARLAAWTLACYRWRAVVDGGHV